MRGCARVRITRLVMGVVSSAAVLGVFAMPAAASGLPANGLPPTVAPVGLSSAAQVAHVDGVDPSIRATSAGTTVNVGDLPTGVAVTDTRAYVADAKSDEVSVLNLTQSPAAVVATIPVGTFPVAVALSPDGSTAYATNFKDGTLSIIDTATDTVTFIVPVGTDPDGVVQVGSLVYVANLLSGTISVVDPSSGTVAFTITLSGTQTPAPSGLAASPDGRHLYVDDARNGTTDVVDLTADPPGTVGSATVGTYPAYLAIDGTTGYVANATKGGATPGTVSVLDLSNPAGPATAATIPVGSHPYGIATLPSLGLALATNSGDNDVSVINTSTDAETTTVPVGTTPDAIAVTPDQTTAVVTNEGDNTVSILHVNQAPVNSVPGAGSVDANDSPSVDNTLVFSSANGNGISTSDPDAGANPEQVSLSVAHGTLTLAATAGLTFSSGANGSGAMIFTGSINDINTALDGLTYEPTQDFSGPDTLTFSVDDQGNSGDISQPETTTSTVAISVDNVAPTVSSPTYTGAIGNTTFGVGTTPSQPSTSTTGTVLTGSADANGDSLSAVAGTITTANNGSVSMNSAGTFTYDPPAGFTGNDTFQFQVTDGVNTTDGTATVTVAHMVWYVDDNAVTDGTGTSADPFTGLSDVTGPAGPTNSGDDIFLFGSATAYGGGITLKSDQLLIGQSATLTVGGQTVSTGTGTNPTVTKTGGTGTGIDLGEGDTVTGITISSTSGAGIIADNINSFTLDSSDTISDTTGDGLDITGGDGTVTVGAPISGAGGHSIDVSGRTAGTITVSGGVSDTGTGVVLTNNTGSEIDLTGGLTASTGTSPAFTATGGGTITLSGAANTLTTTTATALDVENDAIGSAGLTFASISAGSSSAGPASGIIDTGSGTTGGLTVTGAGTTAGSGGTIDNAGNGAADNAAIELGTNTVQSPTANPIGPVSLSNMAIQSGGSGTGAGVYATNVSDFTFAGNSVTNEHGAGIFLSGFGNSGSGGTFSITGNTLTGQADSAIDVTYPEAGAGTSGTNSGLISQNTIGDGTTPNSGSTGGEGIDVVQQGASGAIIADVSNNKVHDIESSYGILGGVAQGSGGEENLTVTDNTVDQSDNGSLSGSENLDAISVGSGSNASVVCVNPTGNHASGASTNFEGLGFDAVGLSLVQNSSSPTFELQGYTGPANDSGGQVESQLDSTNTLSGPSDPTDESIAINNAGTDNFVGGTCTTPASPPAALAAARSARTSTRHDAVALAARARAKRHAARHLAARHAARRIAARHAARTGATLGGRLTAIRSHGALPARAARTASAAVRGRAHALLTATLRARLGSAMDRRRP